MTDTKKWLEEIYSSIDSKDSDKFVSYITEDGQFRFGSNPPLFGRSSIREGVAQFFSMIKSSKHSIVNYWTEGDTVIWQGEVNYTRLDNSMVTIPFVNIFNLNGGLIKDYLIYIDNGPLFNSK